MLRHVILWTLKKELSAEEKETIKKNAKKAFAGLNGKIKGMLHVEIIIPELSSSTCDIMLDSTFENEEAYNAYRKHPLHVVTADRYIRPFVETRLCSDYLY